jgi:thiosulfate dehydrogenase [quinone] large subunit
MPVFYQPFIEHVVLPNSVFVAYSIAIGEILVGLTLLFGLLTRTAAAFGIFMTVNFFLNKGAFILDPINDLAFITGLSLLIAGGAGRSFGLDQLLFKKNIRMPTG